MRLVSGQTVGGATTGALQLLCDGAWGAVCKANFGNSDAVVACRQLGFAAGAPIARPMPDSSTGVPDEVCHRPGGASVGCHPKEFHQ